MDFSKIIHEMPRPKMIFETLPETQAGWAALLEYYEARLEKAQKDVADAQAAIDELNNRRNV